MIKDATQLRTEKLPEGLTVKLIPGGGDSMVHCLSLQELEWKKDEKKISKFTEHTEADIDKLRLELWNYISDNPGHYGINFTPEKRKQFQVYKAKDYPLTDEFLQCFANKKKCIVELYFSNTQPIVFKPFTEVKNERIVRLQLRGIDHFNLLIPISDNIDPVEDIMLYEQVKEVKPIKTEKIVMYDKLNRIYSNNTDECKFSLPLECYLSRKNNKKNKIKTEEIPDPVENNMWCRHYGKNLSVGTISFGLKKGIKVCALYDSCASFSMMSSSLAQHLEDQGILIRDNTETVTITGMGGIRIQLSIQHVYASPNMTPSWNIQNTRWAVMDDDRIPTCVIIGFDFLEKNNIILDFDNMKLRSLTGEAAELGRMHDFKDLGSGTVEIKVLKQNNFKNEIQIFEDKIPKDKISIPSEFLEHFTIDLKKLLIWQENINQDLYNNVDISHYSGINITKENLNPINFVKFHNDIENNNEEIKINELNETINCKLHGLNNLKNLDFYSDLPIFFKNICSSISNDFEKLLNCVETNQNTKEKEIEKISIKESQNIRLLPIKINWSLLNKVKYIDGMRSNNISIYDHPEHIIRYSDRIEVVPDLDLIKTGVCMYQILEECKEEDVPVQEEEDPDNSINHPELIVLWNSFNNPKKGQILSNDKLVKDVFDVPDMTVTDGRNFINQQFNIEKRSLNLDPDEIDNIRKMQEQTEDIKLLRTKIENEDFSEWKNPKLRKYFSSRKKFYINSNILVWHRPYDNKILPVVSDSYMLSLIIIAHVEAHKGARKIEMEVKNSYYCPGIVYKTKEVTSSCFLCQINKVHGTKNHERNPPLHITAEKSLDLCYGDITFLERSNGNIGVFNIIDVASRKAFSVPIKNRLAGTLIRAFEEKIKPQLLGGHIVALRLDNAKEHHSRDFVDYFKNLGTKIIYGIPNKSSSAGMVERFNLTLKERIKMKPSNISNQDWVKYHHTVVEDYNNTYHDTIGQTPNRRFIDKFPETCPTFTMNEEQRKKLIDSLPIHSYFRVGDKVLLQIPRIGRLNTDALKPYYDGPYTVKKITIPNKCFIIQHDIHKDIQKKADHDQMRKFKTPPKFLQNLAIFQELMMPYHPKHINPYESQVEKVSLKIANDTINSPDNKKPKITKPINDKPKIRPMWEIMELPKPNTDSEREYTDLDSSSEDNNNQIVTRSKLNKRKISLENRKKLLKLLNEQKTNIVKPSKLKEKIIKIHKKSKSEENIQKYYSKKTEDLVCTSTGTESALEEAKEDARLENKLIHKTLDTHKKNKALIQRNESLVTPIKLIPYKRSVVINEPHESLVSDREENITNGENKSELDYTNIDNSIKIYNPRIFPVSDTEEKTPSSEKFTPLNKYQFSTPKSSNYSITPPPVKIPDITSIKKYNWNSLNNLTNDQIREMLSPNPLPDNHPFIDADRVSRRLEFEGNEGEWVDEDYKTINVAPLRNTLINRTMTKLNKQGKDKRETFTIKSHAMRTRLDLICYNLDMRLGYFEQLPM
ncbi:unnamed protein product [Rotaria magnacalcarata]|nr:unnamed protein product [Rotaria magnacalcarata]